MLRKNEYLVLGRIRRCFYREEWRGGMVKQNEILLPNIAWQNHN